MFQPTIVAIFRKVYLNDVLHRTSIYKYKM